MEIAIRVDASAAIGTGHMMRCRTLAQELKARGARVCFVSRDHDDLGRQLLADEDHVLLPRPAAQTAGTGCAAWLGVTQRTDSAETMAALDGRRPDTVVVDHYSLDAAFECELAASGYRIVAIDDLHRSHACDVLVDPNFGATERDTMAATTLLGARYAILRPDYRRLARGRVLSSAIKRVFVFFGGIDKDNATSLALTALSAPPLVHLEVEVLVGAGNPHRAEIERLAASRARTRVLEPRPQIAELMACADLAVGAGGTTTWERCCLGLPSIVLAVADNQIPGCSALSAVDVVRYLGRQDEVDAATLTAAIRDLLANPAAVEALATRAASVVDGWGAPRVAEAVMPTTAAALQLRPVEATDARLVFGWINDPEVRRQSFTQDPVAWPTHAAWFARQLASPDSHYFVMEAAGLPVGQIRFDVEGDVAHLSYLLDPLVRRRGWAGRLVALGLEAMDRVSPYAVLAEVRPQNPASHRVFESLGFARTDAADRTTYRRAALSSNTATRQMG